MFVNKLFTYLTLAHSSKSKMCLNVKSSTYYFHMKVKILPDFQNCISVLLSNLVQHFWENCFRKPKLLLAANRLTYLNVSIGIRKIQGPRHPCVP